MVYSALWFKRVHVAERERVFGFSEIICGSSRLSYNCYIEVTPENFDEVFPIAMLNKPHTLPAEFQEYLRPNMYRITPNIPHSSDRDFLHAALTVQPIRELHL